ncbi:replicative DNA helicase [Pseudanabaena sp. UWO311]|uniref:replicative DNA helicase n=1 Tax=Pseudanabaena sp. UWO311 TaxID=2487337 RepID=UPI001158A9FB|nr:replicative DNA helicase [Pseudanabaena sp. UWO311]TYQ25965.1 replicative DNA helicase [Pseudanabaena sp. UWO311]
MSQDFESISDRLPPQNIEAEEAVLGGILIDPEAVSRVLDTLRPEMFYVAAHQEIFRACLMLHNQSNPTDMMSLTTWLSDRDMLEKIGGQTKIAQLCDRTVSAVNIDFYAQLVADKYARRKLAEAARGVVEISYSNEIELPQLLDQSEQKIFAVTQSRAQQGLVPAADILTKTFYELENRFNSLGTGNSTATGLITGFYDFDAMTNGLQRSDLIVLAGRPSMGKTAFGLEIARKMAEIHRLPVAIFSLEMSKEQLVYRLLASQSKVRSSDMGIDSNRLRTGQISENEWGTVAMAISGLSELPLFIDDTPNPPITELRSKARRLQSEKGGVLGLILIDYLQLMEGSGSDNRVQEISRITRSLKALARELNVPVIALSQLSRGVEARTNKRPMLSDLRESGCLSGDSLITMADTGAEISIRDLVGKSDFAIWAVNPQTFKRERAIVSNAFCTGSKPVYQLKTQLGRSIKATANHQFLTIQGWKRLDELQIGDCIAMPRQIPSPELQTMGETELALLGHLIGDGCTLPRHAIQYTTREIDLAELVSSLATEVFREQISPRIKQERDWYQVYLESAYHLTHGVKNPVTKWLENLGVFGLRSHEKFIPCQVFEQPQEAIALFLRHLWATDGCILTSKKSYYPVVYYASSSEKLSTGVQSLLLRIGINATLRVVSQGQKGRDQYHVVVGGKPDLEKFINLVGAVGKYKQEALQSINIYINNSGKANTNRDLIPKEAWKMHVNIAREEMGLTTRQMQASLGMKYCGTSLYKNAIGRDRAYKLSEILESEDILNLATSDIYWDKVKTIDLFEEELVYDLTVPILANFVANNFYVHNSIEQDADLVINLYRDEYYNPETPDRGVAEIIIAKHRNGPVGTVKLLFEPRLTKFENMASSRS